MPCRSHDPLPCARPHGISRPGPPGVGRQDLPGDTVGGGQHPLVADKTAPADMLAPVTQADLPGPLPGHSCCTPDNAGLRAEAAPWWRDGVTGWPPLGKQDPGPGRRAGPSSCLQRGRLSPQSVLRTADSTAQWNSLRRCTCSACGPVRVIAGQAPGHGKEASPKLGTRLFHLNHK